MTAEPDRIHTQTSERSALGFNTNESEALNGAELSVTDSQMEHISQEVREEENRKLEVLKNTPAFDVPDDFDSEDQTPEDHAVESSTEKHPHPAENIELPSDGLPFTITHDPSESSSQSSSESSSSPNHTLNGICSPSQHPVHPPPPHSANQDSRQTGDASPTSPHKPVGRGSAAALGHLDTDGLSLHSDAVQVRLRQMEAGHQLQVETLKKQVQELWSRLHINGKLVRRTL